MLNDIIKVLLIIILLMIICFLVLFLIGAFQQAEMRVQMIQELIELAPKP